MFADDTNLFFAGKNILHLQSEANVSMQRLQEWFTANKLSLNVEKTCFTLFTNKKMVPNVTLTLNGKEIARVPVTKYLGMNLDENLNWTHHVEYVINKLVKLRGAFYYLANMIDDESIRQIYYAYVFPHIKYGIEIYGTCNESVMKRLQVEQNKLLKILYKKNRRYGTNRLYSEVKLLKCEDIHRLFIGIFVYKQQNKLLPVIFDNYFILNADVICRATRQSGKLHLPLFRTKYGQKSTRYVGVKLWNDISESIRNCTSLYLFKKNYKDTLICAY